jgi:hypothetical protein
MRCACHQATTTRPTPRRQVHLGQEKLARQRVLHLHGLILTGRNEVGVSLNFCIDELIVPIGAFFHAQTPVSFHIIEELSPNVRMNLYYDNVYNIALPNS